MSRRTSAPDGEDKGRLYTWAHGARVVNDQRRTPCRVTDAFLHSEGTVTFDVEVDPGPVCLLHAEQPNAYRYEPASRLANLQQQAREVRSSWARANDRHDGRPPVGEWERYEGSMGVLASTALQVLAEVQEALTTLSEQRGKAGGGLSAELDGVALSPLELTSSGEYPASEQGDPNQP